MFTTFEAPQQKDTPESEDGDEENQEAVELLKGVYFLLAYGNVLNFYLAKQKKDMLGGEDQDESEEENEEGVDLEKGVCFLLAHRNAAHQNKGVPEGEDVNEPEKENEEAIDLEKGVYFLSSCS